MQPTFIPRRLAAEVEFFAERAQAAADAAADIAWDREQRIERAVTFDDVLEELSVGASNMDKYTFIRALARSTRADAAELFSIVYAAKQRVIARRLAEER
jgi:hypothetical protein